MYPRNAASPPRIAVGAVVQISDGAVQTSGVSIAVRPEGGSESAGGGTTSYGASGVVYYAPTQAETDYTAFVVVAYKSGCIPVPANVITSASATAGHGGVDWGKVANQSTTVGLSGTTVKTATDVETDTQDIQSRLPAALSGGRMDSVTNAMGNNVMTAAAAAADLATELQSGLATASALSTLDGKADAIQAKTDNLPSDPADQSLVIAATDALASLIGTVDTVVDGIKATTDQLPDAGALTSIATAAALATVDGLVDAVKAKTDSLTFSVAGHVDANIKLVNDVAVQGDGQPGTEWGP